jgi:FkbM family methyltransferase
MREPVKQIIAWWIRRRGWCNVKIGDRRYQCDGENHWFWTKVNQGLWEPATLQILQNELGKESVYCDIGSWIGPTVLPAASICSQVYCFEPDRTAFMYLLQNISRNRFTNVLPFNLALAGADKKAWLASPRGKTGDSMTSLLVPDGKNSQEVLCLSWQSWFDCMDRPPIDFIKMDVEGGEYALLPAMSEYLGSEMPRLYLSLHPHLLETQAREAKMREVIEILSPYRYYTDDSGSQHPLHRLLDDPNLHAAGSYLLKV